ncbi:MAG: allantoinase PuuE [Gammaproteobacteria bacterium]|nr:allantoinase PuuE [Gammaproteobacteria bacterium]
MGYRNQLPQANWPGGARIAVNFCINYEEGAEMCVLSGDAKSECRVSDVIVEPRVGKRDLNIESNYEFGARVGYWRLLKAFTDRGLVGTVNLVGVAGEMNPYALDAMIEADFDLQPHGWRWIDYHTLSEDQEREHIEKSIEQVVKLTGEAPLGYYAGLPSINTRRLVVETGSFLYDSDSYNDDLPYWTTEFDRPHLVLPYSLDTNDSRFARGEGYQVGEEFYTYIKDAFDCLYEEGAQTPKMLTIGLHARLLGRPGRIGSLHRILDHMMQHDSVWICRRGDIAQHWATHHPYSGR